jgi:glutamine phosphoribosylpyrophosphate amidotransferase
MCGVLGILIKDFKEKDCGLIRDLFLQSMIRGKHATGVSYVKNNIVNTIKEPVPANEFISKQDILSWKNEDGNLYCIGHIRYSTSDLRYNQPISTEKLAIAHNGVISQESKDLWEELYGYKTITSNDSELILRALENNEHPLEKFRPSSMAVCTIDHQKKFTAFRNEARPLYYSYGANGFVFTSTSDIAKRSGLSFSVPTEMYREYTIIDFNITDKLFSSNAEDLQ